MYPQDFAVRIPGVDQAIGNLVKWSVKDEWASLRDQVFAEHFSPVLDRFELHDEELVDLLGKSLDMIYGFILEDFFAARFGEGGEVNVIDDYLKRRGWCEKVLARRYLEAIRDSVPSLYEVVDLEPGRNMTLRDLIRGGAPLTVEEKLGSKSAARWDRIAGRIVTVNNKPYFTGGLLLLPHDVANAVLSALDDMTKHFRMKLRAEAKKQEEPAEVEEDDVRVMLLDTMGSRIFSQAWLIHALDRALAPMPEIRNTDGDQIVFSEVRFPIRDDAEKVAAILDGIDGFERNESDEPRWTWHGRGSPSQRMSGSRQEGLSFQSQYQAGRTSLGTAEITADTLVLSTNSRERAERGRDLFASHLGNLVGSPLTSHQDLEKMLEERPESTSTEPDLPPEIAEQAVHSYLDDHYRRSLDDQLPNLGDKTPRQAAKTKKGRAQVVDWLKQLENSEIRRAAAEGQKPYNMAWMWRELNIDGTG